MKLSILATVLMATFSLTTQAQKYLDTNAPIEERIEDALGRMTTHEKIKVLHAQSKFTSAGVPRLGIRQLNMDDGPHGVREELEWNTWSPAKWTNDSVVAFPSLTCLASTWNREISSEYGNALSEEFAFRDKNIILGPGINIARTAVNGRAFEYLGEDPYLAGEMIVPYIKSAQKNGVACCVKHFALNNQEIDRFTVNVNLSERALREIYLPAFKKAVQEADVWTVMGSYSLWKNVHMCQNDELLNKILKEEWGFKGALISDWDGTTDTWQAATGGLDIEMGTYAVSKGGKKDFGYDDYFLGDPFEKLINEGKLPMSVLDEKVRRVLRTMFLTSMNPNRVIGSLCSEAHYDVCRRVAEEGIVLLKNNANILPLDASKYDRILVVGENATRSLTKGGGSSELKTLRDISPLDALKKTFGNKIDYAKGYDSGRTIYERQDKVNTKIIDSLKQEAIEKAKNADLIIYVGGMNKNHGQDCENSDRREYNLSYGQNELIAELAKVQKNIIVANFAGNPYAMPWLNNIQALLQCWYLGSEAGTALVNVLTGKVNPSGKLPVTIAKNYEDYPYVKYGKEAYPGINKQVTYKEDIYVGYRHFTTNKVKAQFPFGFGLSYTTFKYGKPTINGNIVSINITNTGKVDGKETIQLYAGLDECDEDRPQKELKDFTKISLKAGETKTVSFDLSKVDFRYFSTKENKWKEYKGKCKLYLSSSADDNHNKIVVEL